MFCFCYINIFTSFVLQEIKIIFPHFIEYLCWLQRWWKRRLSRLKIAFLLFSPVQGLWDRAYFFYLISCYVCFLWKFRWFWGSSYASFGKSSVCTHWRRIIWSQMCWAWISGSVCEVRNYGFVQLVSIWHTAKICRIHFEFAISN